MALLERCGRGHLLLGLLVLHPVPAASQTREELRAEVWRVERIEAALRAIEVQRAAGLLSRPGYDRRREMLNRRLDGTFVPTMLSVVDPPGLLQNGGFEQVNRNTRPHQSRWLWWQGWRWEGALGQAIVAALEDGTCVLGPMAHRDYYGRVVPARGDVAPGEKGSLEYANRLRAERGDPLLVVDADGRVSEATG